MLKKAAIVAAAVTSLTLAGSPAFAAPSQEPMDDVVIVNDDDFDFEDAFETFIAGGGALGWGAAALIAGAYTGIALTPSLIIDSLGD